MNRAHDVSGGAMPWEAKLSCAALDGADDLVGDVLMNVEAFVCHDISPLLAGRHCGASMRPERAGRTGAGGKKAGQGIEGGAAGRQWPRCPFLGETALAGEPEKVLRPWRALPGMQQFEAHWRH